MDSVSPTIKESIAKFAFTGSTSRSPLRRSSRIASPIKHKETEHSNGAETSESPPPLLQSSKRPYGGDGDSPEKKQRLAKRGYADPSKYAHLSPLHDHLAPDLDVLFCGINPGCMSATKGHHFANPTNHFWRGLHRGGFTPRLLSPSEDRTLPSLYSLGLTNLVPRASVEQAELSKDEMRDSVPALVAKIIQYRPCIFCIIGKGVSVDEQVLMPDSIKNEDDLLNEHGVSLPKTPSRKGSPKKQSNKFDFGLQPYKFVYSKVSEDIKPGVFNETLFFVMPSTSGRVVSHQLNDKVKLFAQLRGNLSQLKAKSLDTSRMTIIPTTSWIK